MNVDFLVIGAGPTGIGAAHNLARHGEKYLLIDSELRPGGLASSAVDAKGFVWDMGGHVQFSHYDLFDSFMEGALGPGAWLDHVRKSWIWVAGRFVPFPLQRNLHYLPGPQRALCIEGLRRRSPNGHRPVNFREWIDHNFGDGIAQVFMSPYNFKTWAHPLEMMGCEWVGDRVAMPSPAEIESAEGVIADDVAWGPNNTFRFPRYGGTGAIWTALADQLEQSSLRLGDAVVHLDPRRHVARTSSGLEIRYGNLISSAPLDRLVAMARLGNLGAATQRLRHSSTHVVGIGLDGEPPRELRDKNWMYFPESNCPFYRVTVFSNYSPNNVPSPSSWSLMAEVSESEFKRVDHGRVVDQVVEGMRATGLVGQNDRILSRWHRFLEYGYPIPTVDRDQVLGQVLPALEALDVYSRGRFGAWKYEVANQDHSFMQGWECVDRICSGADATAEPTLTTPDVVNSRQRTGTTRR